MTEIKIDKKYYLDREAAIDAVDVGNLHRGIVDALQSIIAEIPIADVKPVVRGKWVGYPDCLKYPNAYAADDIVCSVCEECFNIMDNDTERFDFCPHCGADMRECEK